MSGKVYLVGAGPGDPELLTLKALRLLKTADAVLHDDLVPLEILSLASPFAQLHKVGKRCGKKDTSQEEINFLLISLAGSGATVVRLKSGDPLIFGRAGEEIEALREAGIECEVVPGITSALAAAGAAQIPLTDRRVSPSLVFLTGHRASGSGEPDWKGQTSNQTTLVIYMPGRDYKRISASLKDAGLPPEIPCAIVSNASRRDQQILVTTLRNLDRTPELPTPSILLVGEVVRLAKPQAIENAAIQFDAGGFGAEIAPYLTGGDVA